MKNNQVMYGIIKSYTGIFTKTHAGNTHMYLIALEKNIIGLIILGELEDTNNTWACHQFLSAPIEYTDEILETFKEDSNFEIIEILNRQLKTIVKGWEYKIIFPEKGKWLKSGFDLIFSPEYSNSNQNTKIFLLKGKISFLFSDSINSNTIKMSALTHSAKLKSIMSSTKLNKFIS